MQFSFKKDNKCFDPWPIRDTKIYHKHHSDFFPRYPNAHLGNTLLVDNTPYKTYQNPPFNVIFIESYKEVLKEDSYFPRILLLYLKFFHYFGFSIPTFVENYPFGAIKRFKEDDVKF